MKNTFLNTTKNKISDTTQTEGIKFPDDVFIGTVLTSGSTMKYIEFENKNIFINQDQADSLLLNDVVVFRINEDKEAEIISISERPLSKMTCRVKVENGVKKIIPFNPGIKLIFPKDFPSDLYDGDIILIDTDKPVETDEYVHAKFIKKIGRADDPNIEDEEIARNYGFDNDFSEEYMAELATYPEEFTEADMVGRVDYRKQHCFTIDGIYTKDMDDGVYAEKLNNDVTRVYVHLNAINEIIKPDGPVYMRALAKTVSCYIQNSVFALFHSKISNGIGSLNEGKDRLTKTIIMDVDKQGNIIDFDIVKSVINSKKKMAYDAVDQILLGKGIPEGYEEYVDEIKLLYDVAMKLKKRYIMNGRLEFANLEAKETFNEDGTISTLENPSYSPGGKLIEFLMTAAGETIGNWALYMGIPMIFRVLEPPPLKKVNKAIDKINKLGFKFPHITNGGDLTIIRKIINETKDNPLFPIISDILIKGMHKARYSVKNLGHFAQSLIAYMQITSLVRRFPDYRNHMIIDKILDGSIYECDIDQLTAELTNIAHHSSIMERNAKAAEEDGKRRGRIRFFEDRIGQNYEAMVCEMNNTIRVLIYDIDTMINYDDVDENFIFDNKKKRLYDTQTGEYLYPGTKVIVEITEADHGTGTLKVKIKSIVLPPPENKPKKKQLK